MSSSGGVIKHSIRWQDELPVGVEITLKGEVSVYVDLLKQQVAMVAGEELKAKKKEWCLQIAIYLARQALLKIQEESRKKRADGRSGIQFEARPDPNITWWG
jgi:hypothetical protein